MTIFEYKINQNREELLRLLKASSVAYQKSRTKEFMIGYVLFFLAIAYPICYMVFEDPKLELYLFGASFFVTIIAWSMSDYFRGNTEKGALLKEKFDTTLYNLPWKFTLDQPDEVDIISLEKEYEGEDPVDWYPGDISERIPQNNIIAMCQRISSSWDIKLRWRYRLFLYVFIGVYWAIIFTSIVVFSIDGHKMFLIFFSTLAFYEHIIGLIRGNTYVIKKRRELVARLDDYINNRKVVPDSALRDIQDEIYFIRQEPSKVPSYFFKSFNPKIKEIMKEYVQKTNKIYTI